MSDGLVAAPLLSATDRLSRRPARVLVCGTAGSGKTTTAGRISATLDIPHVEIDALFHGPGWQPREAFVSDVTAFAGQPRWVTEWQYDAVRPLLLGRADLLVWLDLPRSVVMRQVVARTLRRRLWRQRLWNGNVEQPLWTVLTDREHIIRWAWSTHHHSAQRVAEARLQRPELAVVRLPTRTAVEGWLSGPLVAAAQLPLPPSAAPVPWWSAQGAAGSGDGT